MPTVLALLGKLACQLHCDYFAGIGALAFGMKRQDLFSLMACPNFACHYFVAVHC